MPTKLTDEIIIAAISGFETQKAKIDDQIAELRTMLAGGTVGATATKTREAPVAKRKKFSVAARRRMAEAQKLRYAKQKGETQPPSPVTPEPPKTKRTISAEGMKRIIAATKKRWRLQKAKAAEASAPAVKKTAVKAPSAKATKTVAPVKKAAAKKSAPAPAVA
jgi:hypothetical protein